MMNREAHMNSWLRVTFDQMQQTGAGETGEGVLLDIFFNRHSRVRGNPANSDDNILDPRLHEGDVILGSIA